MAVVTVSELASALRAGELPSRAATITFDDGCASAVRVAAPLLAEYGLTATYFCVAGYLGGTNDWPTQPKGTPRLELASPGELHELAELGFEIGAHGFEHEPLENASQDVARREVVDARGALEDALACAVRSFAWPYGVRPNDVASSLIGRTYEAVCGASLDRVREVSDPLSLPRVDVHYVRRPAILRRVLSGSLDPYLRARALSAGARRVLRWDRLPRT